MVAGHDEGGGSGVRGGIARLPEVRAAAQAYTLGLDGWKALTLEHPADGLTFQAIMMEAEKLQRDRDRALAVQIADAVGEMLGGKK